MLCNLLDSILPESNEEERGGGVPFTYRDENAEQFRTSLFMDSGGRKGVPHAGLKLLQRRVLGLMRAISETAWVKCWFMLVHADEVEGSRLRISGVRKSDGMEMDGVPFNMSRAKC